MHGIGAVAATGRTTVRKIPPNDGLEEFSVRAMLKRAMPQPGLSREANLWRVRNWPNVARGLRGVIAAQPTGMPVMLAALNLRKTKANGEVVQLGLAGTRVVTDAWVNFLVDQLQGSSGEIANFVYHGFGTNTGGTAEAAGDTALDSELSTEYSTDSTRPQDGSPGEGANQNIYQTVATVTVDASVGIEEHGVFDQASTGGGTLLDRTTFSVVNLSNGDSLQATYELTVNSGG